MPPETQSKLKTLSVAAVLLIVGAVLGLVLLGAIVRMLCEERLVVAAYPAYREYARGTKRMVPYVF